MKNGNPWLDWARELQFLSQCALTYCKDVYDIERFERIREISAEMVANLADTPVESVRDLFCGDSGYQTPKIETRSAVFVGGRVLLVQERDGLWCLPGGWVDHDLSIRENAVKEVFEESGLTVRATRLVALQDRNRHHERPTIHEICSVFLLCEAESGQFIPNAETIASGFFDLESLPPLAEGRTTRAQIEMCFRANADPEWQVQFD